MFYDENISLKPYNTFRVDVKARFFVQVDSVNELESVLNDEKYTTVPKMILGWGSNILFRHDYQGLVIKVNFHGREILAEDDESVTLRLGAGENWHEFVMWSAESGWSGVENLAYIPGTVGAAPVQNLAAYGQTFEDVLVSLNAIELATGETRSFTKEETEPAYRTSVFKTELKNKYLVSDVTVKLSKIANYDTHYHGRY
ncbi:FAD-binding protein, partial [candidate division WWE3 bacterium]|nr:FAD-binding protein [candidate division WWE3 bacterium]